MSACTKCKLKVNVPQFTASCGCSFCAKCIANDYNLHEDTVCQVHGSINKELNLDAAGDGHNCSKKSRNNGYHEDCACALKEFPCMLYHLGCSFKGSPLALDKHQNEVRVHTDLIIVNNFKQLEEKFESQKQQLTDAKEEIDNLKETTRDLKHKIETEVEFPIVKHRYTHIWKIENFSKLQNENKDGFVRSDAFFSGPFGYKLSVEIYPNGNGQGKGTHLSCYLCIMKGPWDDILQWPMNCEAKFTFLSQLESSHYPYSFEFAIDSILLKQFKESHDPNSIELRIPFALFDQPLSDIGTAWGREKFILLQDLKPFYLVRDNIFLKVDVNINFD